MMTNQAQGARRSAALPGPDTKTTAASCEWTATEALAHLQAGDISAEQYCANAIQACEARKWANAVTWLDPSSVL